MATEEWVVRPPVTYGFAQGVMLWVAVVVCLRVDQEQL